MFRKAERCWFGLAKLLKVGGTSNCLSVTDLTSSNEFHFTLWDVLKIANLSVVCQPTNTEEWSWCRCIHKHSLCRMSDWNVCVCPERPRNDTKNAFFDKQRHLVKASRRFLDFQRTYISRLSNCVQANCLFDCNFGFPHWPQRNCSSTQFPLRKYAFSTNSDTSAP